MEIKIYNNKKYVRCITIKEKQANLKKYIMVL